MRTCCISMSFFFLNFPYFPTHARTHKDRYPREHALPLMASPGFSFFKTNTALVLILLPWVSGRWRHCQSNVKLECRPFRNLRCKPQRAGHDSNMCLFDTHERRGTSFNVSAFSGLGPYKNAALWVTAVGKHLWISKLSGRITPSALHCG